MTQAELDAIPEDGTFSFREEIRDGRRVRIPVLNCVGVLWTEDDEPCMVRDDAGDYWRVGWFNGTQYKRRMR